MRRAFLSIVKISFSKYDYFGILMPSVIFLILITLILPYEIYSDISMYLDNFLEFKIIIIVIFSLGIIFLCYVIGLVISGISSWIIEKIIIKKFLKYPSYNLFNQTSSKWFKSYRASYSQEFILKFNEKFNTYFDTNFRDDVERFRLCFEVVKEHCPTSFGRLNTFISLYGLHRNLCITFLSILVLYLIKSCFESNSIFTIIMIISPLISYFNFVNFLKFYRIYADEVFRAFYIYQFENRKMLASKK